LLCLQTGAAEATTAPRLVVVVSVDQMRYDYLTRFGRFFGDGGLKRLLREGSSFSDAHYLYGVTYTGPGHAVQLTGAYAYRNGVVGNSYFDDEAGKMVQPCDDHKTQLTGCKVKALGASPRNLLASTVGDELRLANRESKVVAISLKDRASVLLAGRRGKAIWFDKMAGRFVSSTYYGDNLVDWAERFNDLKRPEADFGKVWDRNGPAAAYELATADDAPWETRYEGLGRTFPRKITGLQNKRDYSYFKAWSNTPYAMQVELDLVKAAIDAEGLGKDDVPDILAIGISTFDYAGHNYGPHSHELTSLIFDVDSFTRDLLAFLDARVGAGKYVLALTADHGTAAVPEYMTSLGHDAGRVWPEDLAAAVNAGLSKRFGKGVWTAGLKAPWLWVNPKLVKAKKLDQKTVEEEAARVLRKVRGVSDVYTRTQLRTGAYPRTRLTSQIARSFHPDRGGDVYILPRVNWIWGYMKRTVGTGHGTPYRYDTHVPLILFGPGIKPGLHAKPVEMIDLAPTLAHLLRVTTPSQSEGRILHEALK